MKKNTSTAAVVIASVVAMLYTIAVNAALLALGWWAAGAAVDLGDIGGIGDYIALSLAISLLHDVYTNLERLSQFLSRDAE